MKSVVLLVPAALRDSANELGELMGWGPNNYSVPLVSGDVVTHYGLHTWAEQSFVEMVEGKALPAGLESFEPVVDALIMSVREISDGHFFDVIAEHGLVNQRGEDE
jgi:hypothetical protein